MLTLRHLTVESHRITRASDYCRYLERTSDQFHVPSMIGSRLSFHDSRIRNVPTKVTHFNAVLFEKKEIKWNDIRDYSSKPISLLLELQGAFKKYIKMFWKKTSHWFCAPGFLYYELLYYTVQKSCPRLEQGTWALYTVVLGKRHAAAQLPFSLRETVAARSNWYLA